MNIKSYIKAISYYLPSYELSNAVIEKDFPEWSIDKISKKTVSVNLENGSLLLMKGETQSHWLHRLPLSKIIKQPRINLTFRSMI